MSLVEPINVLIVADDDDYSQFTRRLGQQYKVSHVFEGYRAVDKVVRGSVDVLITAQSLPDMSGVELISRLSNRDDLSSIIIRDQMEQTVDATIEALAAKGRVEQLSRPVGEFTLKKAIDQAGARLERIDC